MSFSRMIFRGNACQSLCSWNFGMTRCSEMSSTYYGNHAYVPYSSQGFAISQYSEKRLSGRMKQAENSVSFQQSQVQGYKCGITDFDVRSGPSSIQKEMDKFRMDTSVKDRFLSLKSYNRHPCSFFLINHQKFVKRLRAASVKEHSLCKPYVFCCENLSDQDETRCSKPAISDPPRPQEVQAERKVNQGINSLDTYFDKLKAREASPSMNAEDREANKSVLKSEREVRIHAMNSFAAELDKEPKLLQGLKSLDAYFNKLPPKVGGPLPETTKISLKEVLDTTTKTPKGTLSEEDELINILKEFEDSFENASQTEKVSNSSTKTGEKEISMTSSIWDLRSDSYIVNIFVAMNIAVYLFGLASQQQVFDIGDSSLPFLYGAKVNELILDGEWWRLVTPMFLHSGLLHIGLGSWALLTFGPPVERAYGPLGFCMIYLVGGIFGNLMSFFHTPEGTVGGTGPIYALVGAWVVYLLRNRQVIGKDIASDMIRKVFIMSALNVALGDSLPIDDWTHIGAAFAGALFGGLASPVIQLNLHLKELSDGSREKMESVLLLNENPNPFRLILALIVCCGIFFFLYQYGMPFAANEVIMLQVDDGVI